MRNTKQRDLIFNIINNSNCHMTAIEIYNEAVKSINNISLGTVYRNLNYLVESDKIIRIKMKDNIDRFDKNINHAHIVCNKCGKINDIFVNYFQKLPNVKDYEVMNYELIFNGICNECKEKEK